jgi:hypothetical protein
MLYITPNTTIFISLKRRLAYKLGHFVRRFGYLFIGDNIGRDSNVCDIGTLFIRYESPFIYLKQYYEYCLYPVYRYQSLGYMFDDRHRIVQRCSKNKR